MKKLKGFLKIHLPPEIIKILINIRRLVYNFFVKPYLDNNSKIREILEQGWRDYRTDHLPYDRRMEALDKNNISGMSTENIKFLINEIVRRFAGNGVYLEVGTYQGGSLLSAALFNHSTRCIGIDNFSYSPEDEAELSNNLRKLNNPPNIEYYNNDYKETLKELFLKEPRLKINVYFYDGDHHYENQLEGLRAVLPHLAEKCVILVDDINSKGPREANRRFVEENQDFKSVLRIKTVDFQDWWNGFEVITRGI